MNMIINFICRALSLSGKNLNNWIFANSLKRRKNVKNVLCLCLINLKLIFVFWRH